MAIQEKTYSLMFARRVFNCQTSLGRENVLPKRPAQLLGLTVLVLCPFIGLAGCATGTKTTNATNSSLIAQIEQLKQQQINTELRLQDIQKKMDANSIALLRAQATADAAQQMAAAADDKVDGSRKAAVFQ